MNLFKLDERLEQDCFHVMDLRLCRLLLMNESRYPWFILVPQLPELKEIIDLNQEQEVQLWQESRVIQTFLNQKLKAHKLNVAALGNMVPQLHIHHIARFQEDAAWPAPVWGKFPSSPYEAGAAESLMSSIKDFIEGENS